MAYFGYDGLDDFDDWEDFDDDLEDQEVIEYLVWASGSTCKSLSPVFGCHQRD